MAYIPFPVTEFGGLRLDVEPDQVGPRGAIDLINVDLDRSGCIRTRDGLVKFNSSVHAANIRVAQVWESPTAGTFIIVNDTNDDVAAYSSTGTHIATRAASKTGLSMASLGTASAGPYLYVGASVTDQIVRFDGTTWTAPAGMPNAFYVAVQPGDNRLVAAGASSRVQFSDPDAPETWTAANFVDLHPNDGEFVQGMVSFGAQLFVFKFSKFYVFYGNSAFPDGSVEFNYRTVDTGVGVSAPGAVVATSDGVYFVHRTGIYRTTGGPPVRVSDKLAQFFSGSASGFSVLSGDGMGVTGGGIYYTPFVLDRRVVFPLLTYATPTTGGTQAAFVYYLDEGEWSLWASSLGTALIPTAGLPSSSGAKCLWADATATRVYKSSATATDDDGTAIVSKYRSGFYPVGNQRSQEATIHETALEGIGTPSFSVSTDYGSVPTSGGGAKAAVTLGTSPAYGIGYHTNDQQGHLFSYQVEASSGVWRVNALTHHVKGIRSPGIDSS